jgi:hypothetical protein
MAGLPVPVPGRAAVMMMAMMKLAVEAARKTHKDTDNFLSRYA